MLKKYLIIDIGTSSLRVAVENENLEIEKIEIFKRIAEPVFDPEDEWKTIRSMLKKLISKDEKYEAIIASALVGWVGVDEKGNAVTLCYSYAHQCTDEYEEFLRKNTNEQVFPVNGRRVSAELGVFKIQYLRKKYPEIYKQIYKFISLKDFINGKLCGKLAIDHTSACYTMLYDIRKAQWSEALIARAGVDKKLLPELIRPYEIVDFVTEKACQEIGVQETIPVVAGSVDGSTGILGGGGTSARKAVSVMGTTDVFFIVTQTPVEDKSQNLVINPHVVPGLWLVGGPMGMFGGTLEWYTNHVLEKSKSLEELNKEAEQVTPGSEGVNVFPSLSGERTPFWNPHMSGIIWGIKPFHKSKHIYRAMLEANGYAVKKIMELGTASGVACDYVIALGGGSKSDIWLKIKADIIGKSMKRTSIEEATMAGACKLAMLATGIPVETFPDIPIEKEFIPDANVNQIYGQLYRAYMQLHEQVKNII